MRVADENVTKFAILKMVFKKLQLRSFPTINHIQIAVEGYNLR